ncbi:MAG TPA: sugar phosphate isomerase/epimerase family protein [Acidobacteriaceae bacterium]
MKTLQGPSLFLAQFVGDTPPFDSLDGLAGWAASLGFKAVQLPTHDARLFDLALAAHSQAYCEEIQAALANHRLCISELSTHLQGQLVAVHPAYDALFDPFAPAALHGDEPARRAWAVDQLTLAAQASRNLGLAAHATFSGALAWPYFYPWPQRPAGLIDEAFVELARRWTPILKAFDEAGVDLCYELHPGEDLHDGITFERFLSHVDSHVRARILFDPSHQVLQQLDPLAFLDAYHPFIRAFHVKDAEYRPNGRSGVYGGYQDWIDRPGRFRSLGDGQVDFGAVFSKLAQYDYPGWATLEWEDCLKNGEDGAREGAAFIERHIIRVTGRAFDDFAGSSSDAGRNRRILGLA